MLNPYAAEVVAGLHDWAREHIDVIEAVWDQVMAPKGNWPRADGLTQELFSQGRTVDIARIAASMPHALGHLDQGRVVLTVRGAQYHPPSHRILEHYVKAVALAIDRYRAKHPEPAVTRADMAAFGLGAREIAQIERVLDGERWALTKTGGENTPVKYLLHHPAALALGDARTLAEYLEAQANAWWQSEPDLRTAGVPVRTMPPPAKAAALPPPPAEDHADLRFDWLHPAI